jgi:hypothetical protein
MLSVWQVGQATATWSIHMLSMTRTLCKLVAVIVIAIPSRIIH